MYTENHPEDDVLEQYAMASLSEGMVEKLEEHVLICESCQDRLELTESFVRGMKSALAGAPAPVKRAKRPMIRSASGGF